MANPILSLNQPFEWNGVSTIFDYVLPASPALNIPLTIVVNATFVPASGFQVEIKNNGGSQYISPAVSPTQSALQLRQSISASATDHITITLSGNAQDQNALNNIQSTVAIMNGSR